MYLRDRFKGITELLRKLKGESESSPWFLNENIFTSVKYKNEKFKIANTVKKITT